MTTSIETERSSGMTGTTASTSSGTANSTSSKEGGNSTLYLVVTCEGCTVQNRSTTDSCYYGGVFGSWFSKPWYQNEFGGELDYYQPSVGIVGQAVFGNGSVTYRFPPYGELLLPLNYNAGYQGSPVGASFAIISCQGSLSVKLMTTNGSLIWQTNAYPNQTSSVVSYVYP